MTVLTAVDGHEGVKLFELLVKATGEGQENLDEWRRAAKSAAAAPASKRKRKRRRSPRRRRA